jgi:hypothetical protein
MILLFDVDGVLVENRAYRAAIRQTTAYFAERLGWREAEPTEADIDAFEAESIIVEWDTAAVLAGALLFERLRSLPAARRARPLPGDLWAALEALRPGRAADTPPPDYAALARQIGAAVSAAAASNGSQPEPRLLPGRAALRLFDAVLREQDAALAAQARPLLEQLLGNVYDIDRSPAMQVFQNYVLGNDAYAECYGLPALAKSEPLLEVLDVPRLQPDLSQRVLAGRASGRLFPAIFTARPSLRPLEAGGWARGFPPEGEMARRLVGLEGVPVIGLGKLAWWAQRVGRPNWDLMKPSPAQSMAALSAACTGLEAEAVKAAAAVVRGDHLRYPLSACQGQQVHVFEDSPASLGGVREAVRLLNQQGLGLQLTCHGVAAPGAPKREALQRVADCVHDDVNAGLRMILGR